MANKRYAYRVLYGDKVIEKIDVVAEDKDAADDEANTIALDKFMVKLEEVIEEG